MKRSILRAASAILLACFVLYAILQFFDVFDFLSHEIQVQISFALLLALSIVYKLKEGASQATEYGFSTNQTSRFNLRQILCFTTVISCLLGLAWYWPLPATTIGGTFVVRTLSTIRTMWSSIKDSFFWAAISALAFMLVHIDARPDLGKLCLAILVGAVFGDLLATAVYKLGEAGRAQV
jgi:hypothetical protein